MKIYGNLDNLYGLSDKRGEGIAKLIPINDFPPPINVYNDVFKYENISENNFSWNYSTETPLDNCLFSSEKIKIDKDFSPSDLVSVMAKEIYIPDDITLSALANGSGIFSGNPNKQGVDIPFKYLTLGGNAVSRAGAGVYDKKGGVGFSGGAVYYSYIKYGGGTVILIAEEITGGGTISVAPMAGYYKDADHRAQPGGGTINIFTKKWNGTIGFIVTNTTAYSGSYIIWKIEESGELTLMVHSLRGAEATIEIDGVTHTPVHGADASIAW